MSKRLTAALFLSGVLLSASAFAQDQAGPSSDQMAMMQEMQQTIQTIMQNMQAKGIDPQQFFQQMQNGADPADIQQQLIDKGIIDQDTINKLQTNIQKMAAIRIREQLDVTDAQWAVLQPLIQKAVLTYGAVNQSPGAGMAGFMTNQSDAATALAKAKRELRAATKDPATPPEKFETLMNTFRDAREKARAEYVAAKEKLVAATTVRQQGVLTSLGILN